MSFEPVREPGLPPVPKVSQIAMLIDDENYSQVDLYGQITLRSIPRDQHANIACAWVAKKFGMLSQCESYLSKANEGERSIELLMSDLHINSRYFEEKSDLNVNTIGHDNGFHFIKAWGFGFGSEMAALMGQAYLAEILNRQPIVHWGSNFLYRHEGEHCVFDHFFKPFNSLNISDIKEITDDNFYPPKWNQSNILSENNAKKTGKYSQLSALYFFARNEKLTVADYYAGVINIRPLLPEGHPFLELDFDKTYRYLANKYLRVRDDITAEVESFIQEKISAPFIAVHARGSDKDEGYRALTSIPQKTLNYAKQRLDTMPSHSKLFLMTDDEKLLKMYQDAFGERFVSTDSQRSNSEVGVHYDTSRDRMSAGKEVLIDMMIAAKSNCFIGMGLSNPSQLIYYFGQFSHENYILFGENRLKQFNTHLYKTIAVL